jgi:signal transduction histidine kinase
MATVSKDGRSFGVASACLSGFKAGWSATISHDGRTNICTSSDGVREGSAIRFDKEGIELLFRLNQVPGMAALFAQAGIRNIGRSPVNLVSVSPVAAEFGVVGDPKDWLVTGLHPRTPVLAAISDIGPGVDIFEYGSIYRQDGMGFLMGPVGEPLAYLSARFSLADKQSLMLNVRADMSGVRVDPGETRWGQQVALVMDTPRAALAKWAEWVAESHHALTGKGALCGWNNWNTLGKAVKGSDVLAIADQVLHSEDRLRPSVIQIDSGYEDVTGKGEDKERFPESLEVYAQHIAKTGARPGLLLKLAYANNLSAWTAQTARIHHAVEQGFSYLKIQYPIDPSADIVAEPKLTSFQLFRERVSMLREAAGPETYLVYRGKQMPERAVVGIVDASRVGINSFRKQIRSCPDEVLRSQQFNGRWFAVDYDAYYIGTDIANISAIAGGWPIVRTWMSMVGLSCGTAITSDMWYEDRFKPFWRNVEVLTPPARERVEVADLGTRREWPRLIGRVRRDWGDWTVALLWNPGDKEQSVTLRFSSAGMVAGHRYAVWSFWDGRYLGVVQNEWTAQRLAASGSQHLCFTDLDRTPGCPVLIGSDLHIWCGAAEIKQVQSGRSKMTVELTDAGAREGALFIYSRYQPVLKATTGCAVGSVDSAGENVWRVNLNSRQRDVPQKIELAIILPVTYQAWFWLMICMVACSLLFAAWRYVVSLRLQRVQSLAAERIRIARDMHDGIGASLTKIGRLIAAVDEQIPPENTTKPIVGDIVESTRGAVAAMDEIVWTVNPRNDTLESMANYLIQYTEGFLRSTGISCKADVPVMLPDVPLSPDVRHHVLHAVKEALNNAVKHAACHEVSLGLACVNGLLTITIQDDGCGFTPQPPGSGADGLGNMQNRIQAIRGEFHLKSSPGQGTRVTFRVPLMERRKS